MEFSDWLLEQLQRLDITQAELARRAGISKQAMGYYIAGRIPDADILKKLAKGLRLPVAEVFRAAGLLPPAPESNPLIERAMELFATLPEKDQAEVLNLIEYKTNPTPVSSPNAPPKDPSTIKT